MSMSSIRVAHGQRADDVAGLVAGLHGDDAFAAARLLAVIVETACACRCRFRRRPAASRRRVPAHGHGHDEVAVLRADAPDADGVAALVAEFVLVRSGCSCRRG